jgi:UDP-N-acetylglucosamine/UDP-N-acetylgalactosamine 4-epimerase
LYSTPFHERDLSSSTFLITGGAGFIGSHLVEYLLRYGAGRVKVLDNLATGFAKNLTPFSSAVQLEFIEGDIRDPETCLNACQGIDFVLHQAALGSVPRSVKDPITTNSVNVSGFLNMLVAAKQSSVKKFIYAASSSTYGDSQKLPKVENEIGRPLSPYAVTKLVNELYADVFARTYGMSCVGLRYFNVFGPRQDPQGAYAAVIPLFMKAILQHESPILNGDGEQTRDFTFVENVVQANIKAVFAEGQAINQVYNVAVGDRTSLKQLFDILKNLAGSDLEATYGPNRPGDIRDSLANIGKARELLGYDPPVRIREGLQITWDWFRQEFGK